MCLPKAQKTQRAIIPAQTVTSQPTSAAGAVKVSPDAVAYNTDTNVAVTGAVPLGAKKRKGVVGLDI